MARYKVHKKSTGEVLRESTEVIQPAGFRKFQQYAWLKGFKYVPVPGDVSEFLESFSQDIWIWGGSYIVAGAHADDYIEFEIVDADNLYGLGAGAVLSRYLESEYVVNGDRFDIRTEDGAYVPQGLYLRIRYVSYGTNTITLKTRLYLRRADAA